MATIPSLHHLFRVTFRSEFAYGLPQNLGRFGANLSVATRDTSEEFCIYDFHNADVVTVELLTCQEEGEPRLLTTYKPGPDGMLIKARN